ncbi:MAG TPA: hypothetical protein VE981_03895 [Planctomycetota bacterium]|nr:hypothetical protein [Planctomycetota bacterium]
MHQAHLLHKLAICCPACRSDRFSTYRRYPAADGRVVNRCNCIRCGSDFEYVEDRTGRPVRP